MYHRVVDGVGKGIFCDNGRIVLKWDCVVRAGIGLVIPGKYDREIHL